MLIDSPVFPDELELLPQIAEQSGFRIQALLATHADWDHLLGRLAFPELALGVGEPTGLRLRAEPGVAQRELREADERFYVQRPRPLALGSYQVLPVPGKVELGPEELELYPADGHTGDGTAIFARWCGVLACGDYLSDVEIPSVASLPSYRATLARLGTLVEQADAVVPGHGSVLTRSEALEILDQDVGYLDALERGDEALPAGRATKVQREVHARNVTALA